MQQAMKMVLNYYKSGHLAKVKLSNNLTAGTFILTKPCLYSCDDGTTWIYPRNLSLPLNKHLDRKAVMDWDRMQSLYEILVNKVMELEKKFLTEDGLRWAGPT